MDTFANRLNMALEAKGVSPAELSRMVGVAEGTISNYRKGKYEPKQTRLQLIAKILGVSIPFLLGYDYPMDEQKEPPIPDGKKELIDLIMTELLALSDEKQQEALRYIRYLANG